MKQGGNVKRVYIAAAVLAICALATAAYAGKSDVITTGHNINAAGCKSCHASHNGAVATGVPAKCWAGPRRIAGARA